MAETLVNAWPPPTAWLQEGWITLDGTPIDLTLSSLGARTTLSFNGGPPALRALSLGVREVLIQVERGTDAEILDSWLNGAGLD